MKREVKRQVAKALTARDGDADDDEDVPMKKGDGDGHNMRQANKKKSV